MKRRPLFFVMLTAMLVLLAGTAQARRIDHATSGGVLSPRTDEAAGLQGDH